MPSGYQRPSKRDARKARQPRPAPILTHDTPRPRVLKAMAPTKMGFLCDGEFVDKWMARVKVDGQPMLISDETSPSKCAEFDDPAEAKALSVQVVAERTA